MLPIFPRIFSEKSLFGSCCAENRGNAARFIPRFLYDKSKFGSFVLKAGGKTAHFSPIIFETFLRLLGSSTRMIRMSLQDLFWQLCVEIRGNAARFIPIFLYDKSKFGSFVLKTGEILPFLPNHFWDIPSIVGFFEQDDTNVSPRPFWQFNFWKSCF